MQIFKGILLSFLISGFLLLGGASKGGPKGHSPELLVSKMGYELYYCHDHQKRVTEPILIKNKRADGK